MCMTMTSFINILIMIIFSSLNRTSFSLINNYEKFEKTFSRIE